MEKFDEVFENIEEIGQVYKHPEKSHPKFFFMYLKSWQRNFYYFYLYIL